MPRDGWRKVLTLGSLSLAVFMVLLNVTMVNVNLPDIQRSLGTDITGLEWVVNAYTLPLATLLLAAGTLADIYGRKRLFLISLVLFTVGSIVCTLAPNTGTLLVGRALQGIGAAAVLPGSLAIITHTYPDPSARARAIGVWSGATGLALAAGPLIGGVLGERFGWPSIFAVNIPVGILAIIACARILAETPTAPDARRSLDPVGQVLTIGWIAGLTFALIEGNNRGWHSSLIIGALLGAGVGLFAFIVIEIRREYPMVPLRFFRNPTFVAANLVGFAIFFALQGGVFFLSLYFQNVQGDSAVQAGLLLTPLNAAFMVISPAAGVIAARLGLRLPMVAGCVLTGAGLVLLYDLGPSTSYASSWWRLLLFGVGFALTLTPMTAAILASVPAAQAGTAAAVHTTVRQVGGLMGVAVLTVFASAREASVLSTSHASGSAVRSVRQAAFASGMDAALVGAGAVTLAAALVALAFVRAPARADNPSR